MADYWIKLYNEIIDDPKMGSLPDRLWRRTIELFLLASKLMDHTSGDLPNTKQLAWLLRVNEDDLEMDLLQIESVGIIQKTTTGWFVVNFSKRQASTSDAERKRHQRERDQRKQYYGNDSVTTQSQLVTQKQNTETETETEVEEGSSASNFSEDKTQFQEIANLQPAPEPENFPEPSEMSIWFNVTGMSAFPIKSDKSDLIGILRTIHAHKRDQTVSYLRSVFQEWTSRGYSKLNPSWLDWAISGEIPPKKEKISNPRNFHNQKFGQSKIKPENIPEPKYTPEQLVAALALESDP
ncbi:MAG: hypothetical protein CVU46_17210 [Chloroflexi bacterium HGW-Chloroflexi-8]|jgi:hypothetical protein|nr:MAG: hypothetical protein CVU46_17210 [Chloroflexi bacterium HGW-Chloroflexi-8]